MESTTLKGLRSSHLPAQASEPDLRGATTLFLALADRITEPVALLNVDGAVTYANEAFRAVIGITSDLIGAPFAKYLHPEDAERVMNVLRTVAETSVTTDPVRVLQFEGSTLDIRFELSRLPGSEAPAFMAIGWPIMLTTRPLDATAHLASIIESSDDAIVSKTLNGVITSWNSGAERLFGYSRKEAIGQLMTLVIPSDRLSEEDEILARLRRGERVDHFETVRRRKDGSIVEVAVTVSPIRGIDGTIIGASKVARDITNQNRAVQWRTELAAIIESSDDAIVGKTLNGIVTSWNKSAERIFGYSAGDMIGQSITKIIPHDRLHEEDEIQARLRAGDRVDHFETIRRTKDGRLIDVSVTVSPIRDAEGSIVGASKIARVITERKLAELALRESEQTLRGLTQVLEQRVTERTADLQSALREMEGFTYTISHDLRTPLRAIIANCRLIEEDLGEGIPAEARRHLNRQSDAARKLALLIDDLLRLSRIGRQPLHKVEIDMTALAEEIAEELSQRPETPETKFEIAPDLRVFADPILFRLALGNLMENSTKFTRQGVPAVVQIGVEERTFFIRDNGIGFEQKYEDRIFLPFERLHRDVDYPGTGIGLANVRRIIERHEGRVWAIGQPGVGATFYFRLPAP
ncbi:MAG: PAS domain S-box protein [Fimbriimonas sp.]